MIKNNKHTATIRPLTGKHDGANADETAKAVFDAARRAWEAGAQFRHKRERQKRYTYGQQWSDTINCDGRLMTEADYILSLGRQPLINNMIRQIVKIVIGRYRSACRDERVYDTESDRRSYVADNMLAELDCRMLEEFLISGCAVQRVDRESRKGAERVWIDNVDPRAFFVNSFKDPRGSDIELVGMLHDMSLPEIVSKFARRGSDKVASRIVNAYTSGAGGKQLSQVLLGRINDDTPFDFTSAPTGRFRLIEVWTLECHYDDAHPDESGNCYHYCWMARWFAPDGTLIFQEQSPYAHGSHPFVVKYYPMTDGEVHSFVEDVIDQQRCINRMIVLIDHIVGTSAKGVLLFPGDMKPKNVDWNDIAKAWSRCDGVIPITGTGPHLPQQVVTNNADSAAYRLLDLQMKLFDNISGISDVLAGRAVSPSTGNALFESQLRNSAIALSDLIETFVAFRHSRDNKAENI